MFDRPGSLFPDKKMASRFSPYQVETTTLCSTDSDKKFQITHPFHPMYGQWCELVDIRQTWGEKRAYYYDDHNKLKSLLLSWTNLQTPDLFNIVSAQRSAFRTTDLLDLFSLIQSIKVTF
jgi:hypothetical protein